MASFFKKLFGNGAAANDGGAAKRSDPVEYQGFLIQAAPLREGEQWRLAGFIVKKDEAGDLERAYSRADTFPSHEDAVTFSLRKGHQIIDERGEKLFADGAPSGRV
ncbi:MAG TPA: HlyU family transcriptional regulator [Kiloniellaceae bacterium]|nr:HlyU family transcriptional regulator [Kiloniellaceae bacterium]